jgi:hypothetical protein
MDEINSLSLGLLTYEGSQYLDLNHEHQEFKLLTKIINLSTDDALIINEDKYITNDIRVSRREFIKEILFFLKNLIIIQIEIIKYSKYRSMIRPVFNILLGIKSVIFLATLYIFSIFSKKYLSKLEKYSVRQKNITFNHIAMMKRLDNSKSQYLLIIEDDFLINDQIILKDEFKSILNIINVKENIKILNLSKSFTEKQLGTDKNRLKLIKIESNTQNKIVQYNYPVTNTACAILYKKEVISDLIRELEKLDKYNFIPIDHKLNISLRALMRMNKLNNLCYASVVPGLLLQGSLNA